VQLVLQWEKAELHNMCVCSLRYAACDAHAPYCHLWSAPLYKIFPHFLIIGTIFEKQLLNIKCVLRVSLQTLSEILLILRRKERDMIQKYTSLHVKYPSFLSDFNET